MKKLCLMLLITCCCASAQEGWRDEHGQAASDTASRRSVAGFGGWLLVTSDSDWEAKWNTPSNTAPHFTEARTVARGQRVYVLTFFANPKLTEAGQADITCDLDVSRPNGTKSTHQDGVECFKGMLKGDVRQTYLSAPVIAFVGDPDDLSGRWLIKVTVHDNIRQVAVPLESSFTLGEK